MVRSCREGAYSRERTVQPWRPHRRATAMGDLSWLGSSRVTLERHVSPGRRFITLPRGRCLEGLFARADPLETRCRGSANRGRRLAWRIETVLAAIRQSGPFD